MHLSLSTPPEPLCNLTTSCVFACSNPTDADVTAVQAKYEAAVRDLFDRYKARYGYSDQETLSFVQN